MSVDVSSIHLTSALKNKKHPYFSKSQQNGLRQEKNTGTFDKDDTQNNIYDIVSEIAQTKNIYNCKLWSKVCKRKKMKTKYTNVYTIYLRMEG